MTEFTPHFNLTKLQADFDEELSGMIEIARLEPDNFQAVSQYLTSDLVTVRFPVVNDMATLTTVWSPVRQNEAALDFVLDATSSLQLLASSMYADGWERLLQHYSFAVSAPRPATDDHQESSAISMDGELDHYVTTDDALELVQANPWLLTLFMLRRSPTYRKLFVSLVKVSG